MGEASFPKNNTNIDTAAECKNEPLNYVNEIRKMMHGFGDSAEPLVESAKIIEDVVLRQMRTIVSKAFEVAERRGHRTVSAEDFIFLLRKDKVKLQRLIKYLELKEFKSKIFKTLDDELPGLDNEKEEKPLKKEKHLFEHFLTLIDNTGELMETKSALDYVKYKRCLRAEMISKRMDEARYIEFSKARSISFANKDRHKFSDWIGSNDDFIITKQGYTVLSYLAYETVAQIIDMAFLVRQDQLKIQGDSIDRLRFSYCNPSTCKPYQHSQSIVIKPITPSEIYEALRRYWSPQMDMTGPFHRCSMRKPHLKLLAC